jgi:Flp pilus assembly protein TadD
MKGNIALENLFQRYGLFIFIILSFILYGKTIGHRFALDDEYVVNNERVTGGFSSIPGIFTSYYSENETEKYGYRPLARAMFAAEYQFFGNNTRAFHIINVLLYGILCWLLFLSLKRIRSAVPLFVSILAVLLFQFHPVHTEVVNSLKNREEILCFILSLLSLLCFFRYTGKRNALWLLAAGLLIFAAFLAKETAFVFVLLIPLYLYTAGTDIPRTLLAAAVTFAFAIFAYKLPGMVLPPADSHVEIWQNPLFENNGFWQRLSMGSATLAHYSLQLLFPLRLLFYYGYNMIPLESFWSFQILLSFFIHLTLILASLFYFRRKKPFAFGLLFYFFAISMFSNIYMPITGIVGDRLVFVASAGFCIVLSYFLLKMTTVPSLRTFSFILIPIIFILYGYRTYDRNNDWKSAEILFEADIPFLHHSAKANDLYGSWNLDKANQLLASGKTPGEVSSTVEKATLHLKRVTEIMPGYYNAWNNLGALYLKFYKDTANALFAFRSAVQAHPAHVPSRHNIGYILFKAGKNEEARKEFSDVLKLDSNYIPTLFSYGELLTVEQDFDNAETVFKKVYRLDSLHTGALLNLGSIYIIKNDTATALKYYEPAIEKDRSNKALIMNIYKYYQQKGDTIKSSYYRKIAGQ